MLRLLADGHIVASVIDSIDECDMNLQPCIVVTVVFVVLLAGCGPSAGPGANPPTASSVTESLPHVKTPLVNSSADAWFETMTPATGVSFAYRNGEDAGRYTLLETIGGGVAMLDYDCDGDLDLFFTGGGTIPAKEGEGEIGGLPPGLFANENAWRFRSIGEQAGLTDGHIYSHGCAVADFNRDGFPDVAVAGFGGVLLYVNHGDGTFRELAESAGLEADGWCSALAWGDVDADGLNDLFVVRYVDWTLATNLVCTAPNGGKEACQPTTWKPTTSQLFHNRGDGTFAEEAAARGITGRGNGLGVVAADLNGDGRCEFYVTNDETDNLLYLASENGTFQEAAHLAGVATDEFGNDEGSMGIAVGDFDGDQRPDLFVTNFEREDNSLYRNLGDGMFLHSSQVTGLAGPSRSYVGFGTALADFDSDGWPDLFVANGHVFLASGQAGYRQPPQLFRNQEGQRFEEVSADAGEYFQRKHAGRGIAVGDLDDDGSPDVVVVHQNDPVELLRNRRVPPSWVRVRLRGVESNAEAIGAEVRLVDANTVRAQWVTSGCGYFSQSDFRLLFALTSPAEEVTVHVRWPSHKAEQFRGLAVRQTHELLEGQGTAVAWSE